MRAGVVGADVARQRTAAAWAIAAFARQNRALRDIRQALGVDAASLAELGNQKTGLAAQGRSDAALGGDAGETRQQQLFLLHRRVVPGEVMGARGAVEV